MAGGQTTVYSFLPTLGCFGNRNVLSPMNNTAFLKYICIMILAVTYTKKQATLKCRSVAIILYNIMKNLHKLMVDILPSNDSLRQLSGLIFQLGDSNNVNLLADAHSILVFFSIWKINTLQWHYV